MMTTFVRNGRRHPGGRDENGTTKVLCSTCRAASALLAGTWKGCRARVESRVFSVDGSSGRA